MKTTIVTICFFTAVHILQAQAMTTSDIPSVVLNAFQTNYPNGNDVEWQLADSLYNADFEVGSIEHDVWIAQDGTIKKRIVDIPRKDLPGLLLTKIKSQFPGFKLDDVRRINEGDAVLYQVEMESSKEDRTIIVTRDGTIHLNRLDW